MEGLFFRFHKSSGVICNLSPLNCLPTVADVIDFPSSCSKGAVDYSYLGLLLLLCILRLQESEAPRVISNIHSQLLSMEGF